MVDETVTMYVFRQILIPAGFMVDLFPGAAGRKTVSSSFLKKRTKKLLFS